MSTIPTDGERRQTKLVCIHQPDFFPWIGFFDKVIRSHIFIILDHVQFPKTGGTYCNRVKLLVSGGGQWITAPVARNYEGYRAITEVEFQSGIPWREKMLKTIASNYSKAPYFKEAVQILEPLIKNPVNNLSSYNTHAILTIAEWLNMPRDKFVRSSQLSHEGAATELLISLTRAVGGDTYLCGSGAAGYQEDALFAAAGVELIHREFDPPAYRQLPGRDFIGGLSIIDAFMYCGLSGVRLMLKDVVRSNR